MSISDGRPSVKNIVQLIRKGRELEEEENELCDYIKIYQEVKARGSQANKNRGTIKCISKQNGFVPKNNSEHYSKITRNSAKPIIGSTHSNSNSISNSNTNNKYFFDRFNLTQVQSLANKDRNTLFNSSFSNPQNTSFSTTKSKVTFGSVTVKNKEEIAKEIKFQQLDTPEPEKETILRTSKPLKLKEKEEQVIKILSCKVDNSEENAAQPKKNVNKRYENIEVDKSNNDQSKEISFSISEPSVKNSLTISSNSLTVSHNTLLQSQSQSQNPPAKEAKPEKEQRCLTEPTSVKHPMTLEYMLSFQKVDQSFDVKHLPKEVLNHIKGFKTVEEVSPKKHKNNRAKSTRKSEVNSSSLTELDKWGRKDLSKEIKMAEENKESIADLSKKDPVKFSITELLNTLTVDNYEKVKKKILEIIKNSIESQEKFLDVLFNKAIMEKYFVFLYAKLCKEFDTLLPQKKENKSGKPTSVMKILLLEKCRMIFKGEITIPEGVSEEEEKNAVTRKIILGNIHFISELISIQILSKKILGQCVDNLLSRYEKNKDSFIGQVYIEAVVLMIDKFGTLITKTRKKINDEDFNLFTNQIDIYLNKLVTIKDNNKLPGHVKYKIINLIEKKKSGWNETQVELSEKAKSKKEARKVNKTTTRISQEDVINLLREDMNHYKNNPEEEFNNTTIAHIWKSKISLEKIIDGYVESCIDLVRNKSDVETMNAYANEVMEYCSGKIKDNERKKVGVGLMNIILNTPEFELDNPLIIDIVVNLLSLFIDNFIITYDDITSSGMQPETLEKILTKLDEKEKN